MRDFPSAYFNCCKRKKYIMKRVRHEHSCENAIRFLKHKNLKGKSIAMRNEKHNNYNIKSTKNI